MTDNLATIREMEIDRTIGSIGDTSKLITRCDIRWVLLNQRIPTSKTMRRRDLSLAAPSIAREKPSANSKFAFARGIVRDLLGVLCAFPRAWLSVPE